jgi:hypothetical protein
VQHFDERFIDYLRNSNSAVMSGPYREGTPIFPMTECQSARPVIQAQMIETMCW